MQQRPRIHFTPKKNWINDPNGLLWHDGEYHLYFQHNPYGNLWGNMSWGHAVSKDLISWEELPVAIEGNSEVGIFSGSAIFDATNSAGFGEAIIAIYTSAEKEHQSQYLAYSLDKGRTFTRYEGNPILDLGMKDFRDPKVFRYNNEWRMVVVKSKEHSAAIYSSKNLKEWVHLSDFHHDEKEDVVWECPDLFRLEFHGKRHWVMIISVNPGGINNLSGTKYFIGEFDGTTFTATQDAQWLDWGRDNYAGVTYNDEPHGERIFIGWMKHWYTDSQEMVVDTPWNGSMTIPRKLSLVERDSPLTNACC
jgi:levanase/fructan beta-fructosidase